MSKQRSFKIAIFSHDLGQGKGGGAQRSLAIIASEFTKRGLDVDLLLAQAKGRYFNEIRTDVNVVDFNARRFLTSFPQLIRYLQNTKPDALLTTLIHVDFAAIFAKYFAKTDTRVITRIASTISINTHYENNRLIKFISTLSPYFYPHSNHIIAVSNGVASDFSEFTKIPKKLIETIYNPVITPQLCRMAKENIDHPWFIGDQPPVILAVGRLAPQKDYPTLIKAFSLVHERTPARLVILGEGKERSHIESLINQLNLGKDVYMPGFVDNPFSYMSNSKVFVLSSGTEGLPGSLIQALACGCPVVSTDCPNGPAEILDGGKYGYLTPVGDVEALADRILRVLSGEAKSIDPKWLDQFNIDPVVDKYLAAIGY